jgi:Uma2 family endonuclease
MSTTTTSHLSADDLWNLPNHGSRTELVRGELKEMTPAGFDHGSVTGRLTVALGSVVISQKLGEILAAETGFLIARDPDTVRAPDIAYVSRERVSRGRPAGFWIGAPDLVVETMSPSDTVLDVDEKVEQWLVAGARIVWVLNPRQRSVKVHRGGQPVRVLSIDDALDGEEVVPGFRYALADLFG